MSLRKLGTALFAVLAIGAVMASSAFAAPTTTKGHWSINGTKLSGSHEVECSNSGNFTLESEIAGLPVKLTATGLSCLSGAKIENTTVEGVEMAVDSGTLRFTGVTVDEPAGCSVSESTITTEPLSTRIEMDGTKVYDRFAPTSASRFAQIKLVGCAAEGKYNVTGFVRGLSPNLTGEEKASQQLLFNSTSNAVSELKLGGNPATLEGTAVNTLVGGGNFSASE